MNVPLYHIDAFTDRPFSGNPAAVYLLSEPADDVWMQQVAAEMNLSGRAHLESDRLISAEPSGSASLFPTPDHLKQKRGRTI